MEFYLLTGKSDTTSVAHHIEAVKPDRVVSVGGDGTVKMLAEYMESNRARAIPQLDYSNSKKRGVQKLKTA